MGIAGVNTVGGSITNRGGDSVEMLDVRRVSV